ncbi:MAG: nucleotidyltransferase [Negativicutes bacterium]|nr:nucleotidyltransferase [Negativicutes bacterium]
MLNNHFQEFLSLLDAKGVKFLVVGGYAVGFHGYPRYTGDIDIFVAISSENAEKMVAVFKEFGFPNSTKKDYFLEPDSSIAIGEPPRRIHILTGIAAVTFDECFKGRVYIGSNGLKIPFIGLDALIKTKEALKRDQDELDLKHLQSLKKRGKGKHDASH